MNSIDSFRNTHSFFSFVFIRRELPCELVNIVFMHLEQLFHIGIIRDAISYGWKMDGPIWGKMALFAPGHFKCTGWCADHKEVFDGEKQIFVPCHIYDSNVRKTGSRRDDV
jgi:hypothetical protein